MSILRGICTDKQATKATGDTASAKYGDLPLPGLLDMLADGRAAMKWFVENVWPDGSKYSPASIRMRLRPYMSGHAAPYL